MACDICGRPGSDLADLRNGFTSAKIKAICPTCETTVNKKVWHYRIAFDKLMKKKVRAFMESERKGARHG